MAGLGESCSHVAAVLFYIEYGIRLQENSTVTQEKAYWMPPSVRGVGYKEITDIDFTSPKSLKRKADRALHSSCKPVQCASSTTYKHRFASDEGMDRFVAKLAATGVKSSILSIFPEYSKEFKLNLLDVEHLNLVASLYQPENLDLPYKELLEKANDISIHITNTEIDIVEKQTRNQAASSIWFEFRAGRVTASKLYAVCKTSIVKPSRSLIKAICYPQSCTFTSKQTSWGCKHEEAAKDTYHHLMASKHINMSIYKSGLFISNEEPHIAATPDALVECQCCGKGCLEIKCPYCVKEAFIFEGVQTKGFCLHLKDGKICLNRLHPYYYQIQAQMFCTNQKYCDFVVWTKRECHVERVPFNGEFFSDCVKLSRTFFRRCILVEVLGKFYTVPRNNNLLAAVGETTINEKHCYCEGLEKGHMIRCSNQTCPYQWFHLECLNLERPKVKEWLCPDCLMATIFLAD